MALEKQQPIEATVKQADKLKDKIESKTATNEANSFAKLLETMKPQIQKALPKHLTVERMMRIAQSAYSRDHKLRECDPMTIIAGIVQASQLGLEVNTSLGQAYIIPYYNSKTGKSEAQFQTGYKGELSLAYRTGLYKVVMAYEVFENDQFEYELGLEQKLKHIPADEPQGNPIYYYAIYKTTTGGEAFFVMSRKQVEAYALKYSIAYKKGWSSPWKTDFDSMAKKTCLKRLLNYAPKSIEHERLFSADGSIKRSLDEDMTLVPDEFDYDTLQDAGTEDEN